MAEVRKTLVLFIRWEVNPGDGELADKGGSGGNAMSSLWGATMDEQPTEQIDYTEALPAINLPRLIMAAFAVPLYGVGAGIEAAWCWWRGLDDGQRINTIVCIAVVCLAVCFVVGVLRNAGVRLP